MSKRVYVGIASCLLGLGLFIHGGNKIGNYSEYLSEKFTKHINSAYSMQSTKSDEERIKEFNNLKRGCWEVGGGLATLLTGIFVAGTKIDPIKLHKKKKNSKSFSSFQGRYNPTGTDGHHVSDKDRYHF